MEDKIDREIHILLKESQKQKMKLISYYSGRSIGDLIRSLIDKLNPRDFKHETI